MPIEEGVKAHLDAIGHSQKYQGDSDTAYENAQARMRTYILMDAANMKNGLVVGTGDLSELALGWCTYNGDHMSMYGVNASVPKTLVQYICRAYAMSITDRKLRDVLIAICDTPITPELTPSDNGRIAQKTEEKIGKYDLNDFFLFHEDAEHAADAAEIHPPGSIGQHRQLPRMSAECQCKQQGYRKRRHEVDHRALQIADGIRQT